MNGAQAQLLSAAWISIWARVADVEWDSLETALGTRRTLVRAWCMRRTLFVLPSSHLALYSRGSTRRAEKEVRWLVNRGVAPRKVDGILAKVLATLDEPLTRSEMAERMRSRYGATLSSRRGGGWGSSRGVPWVRLEGIDLPVGYLLHLVGARGVVCSGPPKGTESTYVRADSWVPGWRDSTVAEAEGELLANYLRSFGPASPLDFAIWSGMRLGDARDVFATLGPRIRRVRTEGGDAWIRTEDLARLQAGEGSEGAVRLLPNFDSFLLGHADHRPLVPPAHYRQVYRAQGWVSPTVLVDGKVSGLWSYSTAGAALRVRVTAFRALAPLERQRLREESESLAEFLGVGATPVEFSS